MDIEQYQNYTFRGDQLSKTDDFECYSLVVSPNDAKSEKDYLFKEITKITGFAISIKYPNANNKIITEELKKITISKAKARVNLNLFEKGNEYLQEITSDNLVEKYSDLDDEIIQKWILIGLKNLRKNNPIKYQYEIFNVDGFCNLLSISKKQYIFNASILMEDNLIMTSPNQIELSNGGLYITSKGINKISINKEKKLKYTLINNEIKPIQSSNKITEEYKYDIVFSFAGEDRAIAEQLVNLLKSKNIRIFYDKFEESELWGKNLYEYLEYIYSDAGRYCIILISENYAKKNWTNHERQLAQARAFRENSEYILPLRLDDTKIPGIQETVGYISLKDHSIDEVADLIYKKINI